MSYSGIVFKQQITRNVDKDAVEHQRIDDRGTGALRQLGFSRGSKRQVLSSSSPKSNLLSKSQVLRLPCRAGAF